MKTLKLSAIAVCLALTIGCSSDSDNNDGVQVDEGTSSVAAPELVFTQTVNRGFVIDWEPAPGAESYHLYYAVESFTTLDSFNSLQGSGVLRNVQPAVNFDFIDPEKDHFFAIASVDADGQSELAFSGVTRPRINDYTEFSLNDTGTVRCTNGSIEISCDDERYSSQDANHGRDVLAQEDSFFKIGDGPAGFDFTKIDDDGKALPWDAEQWCGVIDNLTLNVWLNPTDDGAITDHTNTFSFYDSHLEERLGTGGIYDGGACSDGRCDTEYFVQVANKNRMCGQIGWRLPRMAEIYNILDFGAIAEQQPHPAFPLMTGRWYWTAESQYIAPLDAVLTYQVMPQIGTMVGAYSNNEGLPNSRASVLLIR